MARKILREPTKSSREKPTKASQKFKIKNELGLHARAAALFVKLASRFQSDIFVSKGSIEANGKSIMGILMLAAAQGAQINLIANGPDAPKALKELGDLIERGFDET